MSSNYTTEVGTSLYLDLLKKILTRYTTPENFAPYEARKGKIRKFFFSILKVLIGSKCFASSGIAHFLPMNKLQESGKNWLWSYR